MKYLFLFTSIAFFLTSKAEDPLPSNKPTTLKSPKGYWQADIEIDLVIIKIKTIKCDRSTDDECVKKNDKGSGVILVQSLESNGSWKNICEGILLGEQVDEDEAWIKYTFDSNGYISY